MGFPGDFFARCFASILSIKGSRLLQCSKRRIQSLPTHQLITGHAEETGMGNFISCRSSAASILFLAITTLQVTSADAARTSHAPSSASPAPISSRRQTPVRRPPRPHQLLLRLLPLQPAARPMGCLRLCAGRADYPARREWEQTVEARIGRPLDFAAVTDHAEFFGQINVCTREAASWATGGPIA